MAGKRVRAAVYGLSTEGYAIASRMAVGGADVYLIDEATPSAITLNAEMAKTYPNVGSLKEDEPLLAMEPINVAISKVQYLFFSPRIRKAGEDVRNEIHAKFRDAVAPLRKGSSVVFTLPAGFGDNGLNVSLLEHVTGFEVGRDVSYFYYPLEGAAPLPRVMGSFNGREDRTLSGLLAAGGKKKAGGEGMGFSAISSAEHLHAVRTLSRFTSMCGTLEICRHVADESGTAGDLPPGDFEDVFLDRIAGGLFDLRSLGASFVGSNPITYLINLSIKGIDNYVKRLVDMVRATLKDNNLKGSRTRIALYWTVDRHAMRGDHAEMRQNLATRLRDYITDVDTYEGDDFEPFHSDVPTVVIACTKPDLERIEGIRRGPAPIVIKANALCEVLE